MTNEVIRPTNRQVWTHLLCKDCEDILNKGGEGWLLTLLANQMGSFPLFDLLKAGMELPSDDPTVALYSAVASRIKRERLVHLALGIFWKAAAHPWVGRSERPFLEMHLDDRKALRVFLKDGIALPDNLMLLMFVTPPPVPKVGFNLPMGLEKDGLRHYFFYLPGIKFSLLAGNLDGLRHLCLHSSPQGMVVAEDLTKEMTMVFQSRIPRPRIFLDTEL
jgi:hypothetical protein